MIIVHHFMNNVFNQNDIVVGIIIISEYFEIIHVIELGPCNDHVGVNWELVPFWEIEILT